MTDEARRFGAVYSPCGLYRYSLWRAWGKAQSTILWIMLNPSTADHLGNNDATIERCERRSTAWGYERMEVVNLFALRSPYPKALREANDPIGPDNDAAILDAANRADLTLCAWGAHGTLRNRADSVRTLLAGRATRCFGLTKTGEPLHPLYLAYGREPVPYRALC